jgi:hypothetical protein
MRRAACQAIAARCPQESAVAGPRIRSRTRTARANSEASGGAMVGPPESGAVPLNCVHISFSMGG